MKVLVAYCGSLSSKLALRDGIRMVRKSGGTLVVLPVSQRGGCIDCGTETGGEAIIGDESVRSMEEARRIIESEGSDVRADVVIRIEAKTEDEMVRYIDDEKVDLVICPLRYYSLAKCASCTVCTVPCIIPGNSACAA